jgi:hypothetical protein
MKGISLNHINNLVSKAPFLSQVVAKAVTLFFPNKIAFAGCGTTYYCGTTWTGQYCLNGCYAWQGQCRILKQRLVYVWMADVPNCSDMCIAYTVCEAIEVGGTCPPPCPTMLPV